MKNRLFIFLSGLAILTIFAIVGPRSRADNYLVLSSAGLVRSNAVISATATNIGQMSFPTNAGVVQFTDLPVSGAVAGTLESYALKIGGTNVITIRTYSDGVGASNSIATLEAPMAIYTNSLAAWPKVPPQAGASCIVSSNGMCYMLMSTNNAGGGSTTWTGTNKLGW